MEKRVFLVPHWCRYIMIVAVCKTNAYRKRTHLSLHSLHLFSITYRLYTSTSFSFLFFERTFLYMASLWSQLHTLTKQQNFTSSILSHEYLQSLHMHLDNSLTHVVRGVACRTSHHNSRVLTCQVVGLFWTCIAQSTTWPPWTALG